MRFLGTKMGWPGLEKGGIVMEKIGLDYAATLWTNIVINLPHTEDTKAWRPPPTNEGLQFSPLVVTCYIFLQEFYYCA